MYPNYLETIINLYDFSFSKLIQIHGPYDIILNFRCELDTSYESLVSLFEIPHMDVWYCFIYVKLTTGELHSVEPSCLKDRSFELLLREAFTCEAYSSKTTKALFVVHFTQHKLFLWVQFQSLEIHLWRPFLTWQKWRWEWLHIWTKLLAAK